MGRHKQFDEHEALDSALELFWKRGYERTSLQDLVAAMRIGRKSFYDTFGCKRDLYLRALREYHRRIEEATRLSLDDDDSACQMIREVFDGAAAMGTGRGCMVVNALLESDEDEGVRELVAGWLKETEDELCQIVLKGQRDGDILADRDARGMAAVLANALVGFRAQLRLCGTQEESRQLEDQILTALGVATGSRFR